MRIKCPECQSVLSLGQPKPGNYKPKCKHCGKSFRMKISDDDPPKVAIGKGRPVSNAKTTDNAASNPAAPNVTRADPEATIGESDPARATAVVATVDSATGMETGRRRTLVSAGSPESQPLGKPFAKADEMPSRLGGYRILRLLGRGAMGAVYEAKQVSLDRLVALKTIRGRVANNPVSLARFTREAYAAAQLTHHNVVQIYDFGEDSGRHFFSMEWVRGGSLDGFVREKGALDPKLAGGYILQAARGLQFAHRNGMVHRDIKPANLLLSDEGVVKVADLGLVKIPDQMDPESDVGASGISGMENGTQVTMQGTAVGTPAYMAPEQGIDAATVDHRADIYSLGCTLFFLLTGRPPFGGSVISEVLDQHAKQSLPSLHDINARVPESLQRIVEHAMAKRPDDRYASLAEMILDLESFLGVNSDGKFSPTSQQADQWEAIAARYASATTLQRLSAPLLSVLIIVSGLLTVVMPFAGLGWLLLGPALLIAALSTGIVLGTRSGPSAVIRSLRGWIACLSWSDYGIGILSVAVLLLVTAIAGLWLGLIVGGVVGMILGAAYHFLLAAPSAQKGNVVAQEAERFIRDLRIDGADESGVRNFAARYAGKRWQGLFESLFGYESLVKIREQFSADPSFSGSTSSGSLRDKVCAKMLHKADTAREARDHLQLAKIEQQGLQSEGVSASEARDQAWQIAAAVMDNARAVSPDGVDAQAAAEAKRSRMKEMMGEARSGKYKKGRDRMAPIKFALGGQTRLLAGCLLLAVFAIWGNSNGLFDSIKDLEISNLSSVDVDKLGSALGGVLDDASETAGTLDAKTEVLGSSTSAWSIGLAGILLVMSSFISGWRMSPFALAATAVILFGSMFGIPGVGDLLQPWMVAGLVGIAVYVPGILFGETREG